MTTYLATSEDATSVANAIRTQGGTEATLEWPDGWVSAIEAIPTGTVRTASDVTAEVLTVTIPAGVYASEVEKTLTDENLLAANIKKDVVIFGVTGTYEPQTDDETA